MCLDHFLGRFDSPLSSPSYQVWNVLSDRLSASDARSVSPALRWNWKSGRLSVGRVVERRTLSRSWWSGSHWSWLHWLQSSHCPTHSHPTVNSIRYSPVPATIIYKPPKFWWFRPFYIFEDREENSCWEHLLIFGNCIAADVTLITEQYIENIE